MKDVILAKELLEMYHKLDNREKINTNIVKTAIAEWGKDIKRLKEENRQIHAKLAALDSNAQLESEQAHNLQ